MHRTVLDNLPENLRSLNESFPDGRSMGSILFISLRSRSDRNSLVPKPNLTQGIFIYATEDCGQVQLPEYVPRLYARITI